MLCQAITKILEISEKVKKSQQRNRRYEVDIIRTEDMKILKLKNRIMNIKNPMDRFNSRMVRTGKRIRALEERETEITQCGIIKKRSNFCVIRVPEERKKKVGQKTKIKIKQNKKPKEK